MDFALKRCAVASCAVAYGPRSALRVEQALLAANVRALRAGRPTLTPRLGPRSPAAPSLRSGKCWGQAHGQVRAGLTASASADLHHHLPDRRPGPGALAPRTAAPLLGQLSAGASCLVGSPSKHCPPWASGSHSGWTPSCPVPGALRARALRVVVGRFSTFGPLAGLRPAVQGPAPRPGQALDPGAALRHEKDPAQRDAVTINPRDVSRAIMVASRAYTFHARPTRPPYARPSCCPWASSTRSSA